MGVLVVERAEIEHAAERADIAHAAEAVCRCHMLLDAAHYLITGFQIHAGGF